MYPYLYFAYLALASVGPLLALVAAVMARRRRRSLTTVVLGAGAVLLLASHLLGCWWFAVNNWRVFESAVYRWSATVTFTQASSYVVGQLLFFGGLVGFLRKSLGFR